MVAYEIPVLSAYDFIVSPLANADSNPVRADTRVDGSVGARVDGSVDVRVDPLPYSITEALVRRFCVAPVYLEVLPPKSMGCETLVFRLCVEPL